MFERFTDRARRVLVLAQDEARLLEHNYIGTEHILLGLVREGDGVAAKALASLGISLEAVRARVAETLGPGSSEPAESVPFTPRSKKVLELSLREALRLGHNYIGTEHLLLGLVSEGEGVAAHVLVSMGADLPHVRQTVIELLPVQAPGEPGEAGPAGRGDPEAGAAGTGRRARPVMAPVSGAVFVGGGAGVAAKGRPAAAAPRCSRCGAGLAASGRYSTIEVPPAGEGEGGEGGEALTVTVVYCSACGTVVGQSGTGST